MSIHKKITETRNPNSFRIDTLSTLEIIKVINNEDKTVPYAVEKALKEIANTIDKCVSAIKKGGRIFYIGAGTSGRLGVLDASECPPTYGVKPDLVQGIIAGGEYALTNSIEGVEDDGEEGIADVKARGFTKDDVLIGISANGDAPYVVSSLEYAKSLGAAVAAICCNDNALCFDVVGKDYSIFVPVGPEIVTGSTRMKSGTAQKLVLNMISTATMIKLGKVYDNYMIDVMPVNKKLVDRSIRMIKEITGKSEEEAKSALAKAGSSVKKAVVMLLLDVEAAKADALLEKHNGNIHFVIDSELK